MSNNIFKGVHKPTPTMGNGVEGSDWWGPRRQWQSGKVPDSGFNPVYRAGKINPQTPAEPNDAFSTRKPKE